MERDVTLIFEISAKSISTHTLTWSVTVCEQEVKGYFKDFNSHAHVERDEYLLFLPTLLYISTHTLTWSVTHVFIFRTNIQNISTHTLTWSVTGFNE